MNTAANRTVVRLKDFRDADVGKQVSDAFGVIADHVSQRVQSWSSKAKGAAQTTDSLVRSSPWQAMGAVAIIGLAAGLLVSRRARRSRGVPSIARADSLSELSGG